ncbi:MAG: PfkB family carbohydrate kinase, partial [Actinomycetota bacterium]|nr:PfkB family carbohydrate kinase [Actinomycetota bacterium]
MGNSAGDKDRSDKQLDVVGFGNALVDVLSHQNNEFLERINVAKGAMHLIDSERSAELYSLITERKTVSGGSAANTVIGVGSLGGSAGFIGRVADDDLGDIFAKDMAKLNIFYNTPRAPREDSTGRCLIFVT